MTKSNSFEVVVYQKIPYVTQWLFTLFTLLFIFEVWGLAPLFPSRYSTDEVKILYFIVLYPEKLKVALCIGACLLPLIWSLYIYLRRKRIAVLSFYTEKIELVGNNFKKVFPIETIRNINCYDPLTKDDLPKEKFIIVIQNRKGRRMRMLLNDYSQAEKFVDILSVYEDIQLAVYPNNYWTIDVFDE
ncbi:MAG TPA: hypothetical protein VLB84_17655 [Bacteroidia bacterium]|nr:hypothetical protein [Bacteroidia bacterium]